MGWSYSCDTSFKKKDQIERFRSPGQFTNWTLIDSRVVGNHFWGLLENGGQRTIWLALMSGGGKRMGWGYKDMSEDSGPYHYDCPLSLLDKCTAPANENAAKWRELVRQYHAKKKARPPYAKGMVIKIGSTLYRLDEPWAPRRGWAATSVEFGERFRIPVWMLAKAEIQHGQA